jgi:hypothetical protein
VGALSPSHGLLGDSLTTVLPTNDIIALLLVRTDRGYVCSVARTGSNIVSSDCIGKTL